MSKAKALHYFAAIVLSIISLNAACATLYVSPTGSDSTGTGAAGNPWRNIQFAVDSTSFQPGNTIIVLDGIYSPFHMIKSGGSPAARYIIKAQGSAARIIGYEAYDGRFTGISVLSSYVTIDGFVVEIGAMNNSVLSRGIRVSGVSDDRVFDVQVLNNRVSNAGWVGITTSYAENVLVEGNETYGSKGQHGIYVANSADNPTIRRNISHDNVQAGIQINADPASASDPNQPGADGIISGAIVDGNIIYGNGAGGGGALNFAAIRNSRISNNLLFGNTAQGIANWDDGEGNPYFGCKDNLYINNTIVMPSGAQHVLSFRAGSIGNTVRNNILIHLGGNDSIAIDTASFSAAFTSDHNIVTKFEDTAGNLVSLTSWRQQTGQDINSLAPAPATVLATVFTNYALQDFTLAVGSPAIDAGEAYPLITNDLADTSRPQGSAYDIGAYEYVPTVPPALALMGVVSRKNHGALGAFDLPLDATQALNGAVTVEPRAIGTGHTIVFKFNNPITATGTPATTLGNVVTSTSGNNVLVTLTGIPNQSRTTVSLTGINGTAFDASVSIGFLLGDVDSSRAAVAGDVGSVKARSGQAANSSNFRYDLNSSGEVTAADIAAIRKRSGQSLP
ncbi:MAG: right-handed parallel beta-helix repeat-containing protein [Betaproteobacteria bacterium]